MPTSKPNTCDATSAPATPSSAHDRIERARFLWGIVLIVVLALSLRLAYLWQIRDIGFFDQPVSDGYIYVQRAQGIAHGDWLGPPDFVHAPLYAYVLGVVQLIAGPDLLWPRLLQVLFGTASSVLVILAGRRFFDARVALLAGILLALFPPALFFDGLIQKTSLALLLSTFLLWLLSRSLPLPPEPRASARADVRANMPQTANALPAPGSSLWLLAGALLGLLILTRQNALVLIPLLLLWILLGPTSIAGSFKRHFAFAAAALAGLLLVLAPWAVRNRLVTGEFVLTTPNLGQNFAMGNHPDATGTYLPFKRGRSNALHEQAEWVKAAERAANRALTSREVSDYYFNSAIKYIKSNPGAWLTLTLKKILLTLGAYEAPDTEDYYLYRQHSGLLNALDRGWHFGVLVPLAAAGILFTWRQWRRLWLLYGWLLLTVGSVAIFVVFARYRFPLVPVLMCFSAAALVHTMEAVRQDRFGRLTLPALLAACVTLAVNWPIHHDRTPDSVAYLNHAVALADNGRPPEALAEVARALALRPKDVDAHLTAGSILIDARRYEDALNHYQQAADGAPEYAGSFRGMGNCLLRLGRFAEAQGEFRRALELEPDDYLALNGLATALGAQGHFSQAVSLFAQVLEAEPHYAEAHFGLGNTYLAANRIEDAASAYTRALEFDPQHADAWHNLGIAEAQRSRFERARECFVKALELDSMHQDAQRSLVPVLVRLERKEEAIALLRQWLEQEPERRDLKDMLGALGGLEAAEP